VPPRLELRRSWNRHADVQGRVCADRELGTKAGPGAGDFATDAYDGGNEGGSDVVPVYSVSRYDSMYGSCTSVSP
jgi:hypothetical protein